MRPVPRRPEQIIPLAFLGAIAVGTLLLLLPVSRAADGAPSIVVALFTATSAVCVTGMNVVETPTYWSGTGLVLITLLTQVGGFGIMTMATLLSLLVSQRLGLRGRLVAQAESSALGLGNVRRVLVRIGLTMIIFEAAVAAALTLRLITAYDYPPARAVWYAFFHAVQAFNNAGFMLYSDGLVRFVGDWWICLPLMLGVFAGGLGFPVIFELGRRYRRPGRWSTHTKLTVWGSLVLFVFGSLFILLFEWTNPHTFGPLSLEEKVLAAGFQDAMSRSGGLNTVDLAAMNSETLSVMTALMFIGGGSASTAGGIKVSTFFLLAFVIWAEIRGEPDVVIGERRIAEGTQRQAITVVLLGIGVVGVGALALVALSDGVAFYRALFEVTSAFSTAGLTSLPTSTLPPAPQLVLVVLMFVGRVGSITVASGIALNTRRRRYRYPEERPIVG
jgi:Trk-type K+ transport system membrane component